MTRSLLRTAFRSCVLVLGLFISGCAATTPERGDTRDDRSGKWADVVSGVVVDAEGAPAGDVEVRVWDADPRAGWSGYPPLGDAGEEVRLETRIVDVRTDATGAFSAPWSGGEVVFVSVVDDVRGDATVRRAIGEPSPLRLRLTPRGTVCGFVRGGAGPPGVGVALVLSARREPGHPCGDWLARVDTDASGAFRFEDVPSGAARLESEYVEYVEVAQEAFLVLPGRGFVADVDVVVPARGRLDLALVLRPYSAANVVATRADGAVVPISVVAAFEIDPSSPLDSARPALKEAHAMASQSESAAALGTCELFGLRTDRRYVLRAWAPDGATPPAHHKDLIERFLRGEHVEGLLGAATVAPKEGAAVEVRITLR